MTFFQPSLTLVHGCRDQVDFAQHGEQLLSIKMSPPLPTKIHKRDRVISCKGCANTVPKPLWKMHIKYGIINSEDVMQYGRSEHTTCFSFLYKSHQSRMGLSLLFFFFFSPSRTEKVAQCESTGLTCGSDMVKKHTKQDWKTSSVAKSSYLFFPNPGFCLQQTQKPATAICTCNPSTQVLGAGGSRVQGPRPQLGSKFEGSLGHIISRLENKCISIHLANLYLTVGDGKECSYCTYQLPACAAPSPV